MKKTFVTCSNFIALLKGKLASLTKESKKYIIGCAVFLLGTVLGAVLLDAGMDNELYNVMFSGVMLIWVTSIVFCFFNIKKRAVLLLFQLTVFLFLLSRNFVLVLRGEEWWYRYSIESNVFALKIIFLSVMGLCIGTIALELIYSFFEKKYKEKKLVKAEQTKKEETEADAPSLKKRLFDNDALRFVLRLGLAFCMACFFISELDKLAFMSGRPYADYYTYYKSSLPFYIYFPSSCMPYYLCMYLSLKPKKKEAFVWLSLYVISALPMLKIGARGDFILNLLFAFTYYCLRSMHEKDWFGRIEKIVAVACVPVMILGLGAYNYIRDDKAVELNVGEIAVDFLFKQGTTYDTVLQGYEYQDKLIGKDSKYYTFGVVTDHIIYNSLGQKIFDAPEVTDGNSFKTAFHSHSFSHAISYVVLGADYIGGQGRGSSYVIENYIDFGFSGVVLFSVFLGAVCSGCMLLFGKKWLVSVLILNVLLDLFFVARAESLSFAIFLFSYKFWLVVGATAAMVIIFGKVVEKLDLKRFSVVKKILEI